MLIRALMFLALLAVPALAQPPAGYALVWSDEFSTPGLPDAKTWVYDTEANATGWYNGELQYYAARRLQSTRVAGGRLIITARKERLASMPDYGGQDYSSGRLITRGKKAWTYGYFEIRARLPCGAGAWPAIWMLGLNRPWPDGGEIDIMEQLGRDPPTVYGTIHTRASAGTSGSGSSATITNPCSAFHTYHLLWTANRLDIGVDGRVYHSYLNSHSGAASWPFNRPQYMLLNLAIGGPWAGPPDNGIFPVNFAVDYVRVYQKTP